MITTNIYIYIIYIIYIYHIYIYIIYIYHIYISYISYIYIRNRRVIGGQESSLAYPSEASDLQSILLEVWHGFCGKLPWLVVDLPLWNMMDFVTVGMMTFPRYGKVKHVSNHQPVPPFAHAQLIAYPTPRPSVSRRAAGCAWQCQSPLISTWPWTRPVRCWHVFRTAMWTLWTKQVGADPLFLSFVLTLVRAFSTYYVSTSLTPVFWDSSIINHNP